MALQSQQIGTSSPDNADATGNYTITVNNGNYLCGSAVQQFVLDSSLNMTAGKYVLLRLLKSAGSIQNYVGATVTLTGSWTLSVYSISREDVNYSGVNYDCICVTLV